MYKLRQLTRQQIDLQDLKTQIGNQLMCLELGMYQSKEVRKQMSELLEKLDKQIVECEKLIAKAVNDNPEWKRKVDQICAIKGVGLLTVANLITETNEFALFENQPVRRCEQLVSYAGYDVVEYQSGKRVGKTRISKRGNARIRRGLHMASLMVVRYEQRPFVGLYERVFDRTKINRAAGADERLCGCAAEATDVDLRAVEKGREIRRDFCERGAKKSSPKRGGYAASATSGRA